MRAGLLFEGIGGIGLAFQRAGIDNVWSVENNGPCQNILKRHFPATAHYSDVARIGPWVAKKHGAVDLIAGGFPCQDISVAGNREGLAGSRSRLWWEFHRILDEQRPRWCLIENVAGLLSSNGGRDLGAILGALGDLGYGYAYRVLDAQGFGVPQRRRRVFIVGCLGDAECAAEVLLEPESGGGYLATSRDKESTVAALTKSGLGGGGPDDDLAQAGHVVAFRKATRVHGADLNDERWEEADHSNTLDAGGNVTRTSHVIAFHLTQDPISGDVAPAMGAGNRQGHATIGVATEWGVRKLMPIECERLQGFPDDHTDGQYDSRRYKQLGNAVAVPVVEWIARRMKKVHDGR